MKEEEIARCSPKTGDGMEDFSMALAFKLEDMDLKAPHTGPCEGIIIVIL